MKVRYRVAILTALLALFSATACANASKPPAPPEIIQTHQQMLDWYKNAKFGMFIHLGIYSDIAKGEWALAKLPEFNNGEIAGLDAYKSHAARLKVNQQSVTDIVTLAKNAGMRYIILVSRHHDGFSLWDTHADSYAQNFNATHFGGKTDIVQLFAKACQEQGVKLMFYYSLLDWAHPDYPVASSPDDQPHLTLYKQQQGDWPAYRRFMQTQLQELLTRYGQIAGIWFDGYWAQNDKSRWQINDIYSTIKKTQPVTLIANNQGLNKSELLPGEDFTIGERGQAAGDHDTAGETDDTSQDGNSPTGTWGYVDGAKIRSVDWVFEQLIATLSTGKNFVLNVGPRADGSLPEALHDNFAVIGQWIQQNQEAIYGTRAGIPGVLSTRRSSGDNTSLYLFVTNDQQKTLMIPSAVKSFQHAIDLVSQQTLQPYKNSAGEIILNLDSLPHSPHNPLVIKLSDAVL